MSQRTSGGESEFDLWVTICQPSSRALTGARDSRLKHISRAIPLQAHREASVWVTNHWGLTSHLHSQNHQQCLSVSYFDLKSHFRSPHPQCCPSRQNHYVNDLVFQYLSNEAKLDLLIALFPSCSLLLLGIVTQ